MKDRYIYPAVFSEDPDGIAVVFPDLPGCFTCGTDIEEAFDMAKDALGIHLYGMEQDGEPIPEPSKVTALKAGLDDNQFGSRSRSGSMTWGKSTRLTSPNSCKRL